VNLSFLLDEDISFRVAEGLRQGGIDAVSVQEIGRARLGLSDGDQLRFATTAGRVLVTYNRADFQSLDASWRMHDQLHAGILVCVEKSIPRRAIGELIRAIESFAGAHTSISGNCLILPRRTE
jgi:predicted nuclease of predicted toxin-antitoxin system